MLFGRPDLDQMFSMRGYETPTDLSENGHDPADGEGQTYLRVAEIVLSEALSPLKAREIVERGIEQGLFGDHVMSRTPEKSMQARLSTDILSHGQNSRFARTSKGRFTLRSKLSIGRQGDGVPDDNSVEYLAKRRNVPKVLRTPKEEVLCVGEEGFRDVLTFQGIDTDSTEILGRLLQDEHLHYVGRSEAETRDDAKQFITYVLVQYRSMLLDSTTRVVFSRARLDATKISCRLRVWSM
jgi:hypothetical protein